MKRTTRDDLDQGEQTPTLKVEELPPMPGPGAGPDEWREYHKALYEAGKLTAPGESGESIKGGG